MKHEVPTEVQVYDNFFSKEIHLEVLKKLMFPRWGLSGGCPEKPEIFWHYDGLDGPNHEGYFSEFLYEKICEKLDRKFSKVDRIYANGQTAGQCGTPHTDDGDLTFLYYANQEWNVNWQGHLIFMEKESDKIPEGNNFVNPNMETSRIISYKPNRAVLFPGSIWHYADAPSRFFNGLRISLAYKLWI